MKKKEVRLPFDMQSSLLVSFLQSRMGIILSHWVNQGMRYMNRYEMWYRIFLEVSLFFAFFALIAHRINNLPAVLISFLIIHTLFWMFNSHIYVLMRYISERQNDPKKFLSYSEDIFKRMQNKYFLLAVVAFGSLAKGKFSSTSDFDVRFLKRRGFMNSVRAFNLCAMERARAFLNGFPLDIYVFDLDEIKYKIRPDEPPIVMFDPDRVIGDRYKENTIGFAEFRKRFYATSCRGIK